MLNSEEVFHDVHDNLELNQGKVKSSLNKDFRIRCAT